MTAKVWFAVDVVVDLEAAEAVASAFNTFACLGIETDSWKRSADEPVRVSGFFDELPDLGEIGTAIKNEVQMHGLSAEAIRDLSHRTIEQTDWLAEWKRHWKPVEIGQFIIAPPWATLANADKHVIRIEPNMAFGTGTHETTQLCLKAISEHVQPGMSFLDVGTGTGILAMAAAKLGAAPVTACDTDADSIKIARENAGANGVSEQVDLFQGSIDGETQRSDLVCANLTLDVIVPILPLLIEKSKQFLVLSGILIEQEAAIREAVSHLVFTNLQIETSGEWISIVLDR